METEAPELLPGEKKKVPDPAAVPATVTTAGAFGGQPPVTKDSGEGAGKRP